MCQMSGGVAIVFCTAAKPPLLKTCFATKPDGLRYTADCFNRALAQRCDSAPVAGEVKLGRVGLSQTLNVPCRRNPDLLLH